MPARGSLLFLLCLSMFGYALSQCRCPSTPRPSWPLRRSTTVKPQARLAGLPPSQEYNTPSDYLKGHNDYRRAIATGVGTRQPRASDLHDMTWDGQLEAQADKMARKCIFKHEGSGENMYAGTSLTLDPLKAWFDEQKVYSYKPINPSDFHRYGHYTQMVWAKTTKVGCARYKCGTLRIPGSTSMRNAFFTVCKYFPYGNYFGQVPYKRL